MQDQKARPEYYRPGFVYWGELLTIRPWDIRGADGLERLFDAIIKDRPDGLYVLGGGGLIRPNYNRIADFASKSRLPSLYSDKLAKGAGGLMFYGADREDSYRRVASYVDRILRGEKPADLPVEQSTKYELVINLKAANQIGLTITSRVAAPEAVFPALTNS